LHVRGAIVLCAISTRDILVGVVGKKKRIMDGSTPHDLLCGDSSEELGLPTGSTIEAATADDRDWPVAFRVSY